MRRRGKRSRQRSADYLVRVQFARPDERVVYVDHGTSVASGRPYDLIATDLALYVYDAREKEARRFAYDELARVNVGDVRTFPRYDGYLEFTDTRTGTPFGFDDVQSTKGALGRFVKSNSGRATLD
jgi:hypothetical protein